MRTYEGRRSKNGVAQVFVVENNTAFPLNPRLDLANKSPEGFEWGYAGSGPAQLALAILADATGDDARALRHFQAFKFRIIAGLGRSGVWTLTRDTVLLVLSAIETDLRRHGARRNPQPTLGRGTGGNGK